MRIVCAPDSFKESMTAAVAAAAMATGARRADPAAECVLVPLADGGEGTARTLVAATGGELRTVGAHDALGRSLTAEYGLIDGGRTAVVEVAAACGLEHVPAARRDPAVADTSGVGELLRDALDHGVRDLVIGLGGSATNDAGAGMLSVLGARFLDERGEPLAPGGAALRGLASVDLSGLDPRLAECRVRVACDVANPLLGPDGATAVFGPQKGADAAALEALEAGLSRWADVMERATGTAVRHVPGAGAAGGLGAALLAATPAALVPGVDLVLDAVGFADALAGADFLFTGEGAVDLQSAAGKAPWGAAAVAAEHGVRTVMFGGRIDEAVRAEPPAGVVALVPIVDRVTDLAAALRAGPENLSRAAETAYRLLAAGRAR